MRFRLLALALTLALAAPAFAEETAAPSPSPTEATPPATPWPPPTPDSEESATLRAFGDAHPDCAQWGDGCAVCRRAGAMNFCSLPGIACEPQPMSCFKP